MIILGIDPGTNHFACSILEWNNLSVKLIECKSFKYNPQNELEHKLKKMYEDVKDLVLEYKPEVVSIEGQFFGRNARTLRSLCESVGAMKVAVLLNSDCPIIDYTPSELKITLTGKGQASKEEMIESVESKFGITLPDDEADSIAAGLAYIMFHPDEAHFNMLSPLLGEEYTMKIMQNFESKSTSHKVRTTRLVYKKDIYSILELDMNFEVDPVLKEGKTK